MKKTLSRALALCLSLSMCLGLTLLPAAAEGKATLGAAAIDEATFTLTGEAKAGGALTVTSAGVGEEQSWCFNIHATRDGYDRYSIVDANGKQTEFMPLAEAMDIGDVVQASLISGDGARTFTLEIPEKYASWNLAVRIGAWDQKFAEIPLTLEGTEKPADTTPVAFDDVREDDWFCSFVNTICANGAMTGMSETSFGPGDNLTLAQVLALAANLHSSQTGNTIYGAEGKWYTLYYNYCVTHNLISAEELSMESANNAATRFDMVTILDKAVHESRANGAINPGLEDGFIPDLKESDPNGEVVYRWYRSGILSGDAEHRFNGDSNITRAEVAVILCQLQLLVDRVKL